MMQAARPSFEQPATYGLATQLRTPPMEQDEDDTFPQHTNMPSGFTVPFYSPAASKKVTPAMRDELRTSPKMGSVAWTAREGPLLPMPSGKSIRDLRKGSVIGGGRTMPVSRSTKELSRGRQPSMVGEWGEYESTSPKTHTRNLSLPTTNGAPPARPARPTSPTASSTSLLTAGGLEFAPVPRLDLGVQLEQSYQSTFSGAQTSPDFGREEESSYEDNVSVGVAQRINRSESFRKASLGAILGNSTSHHSAVPSSRSSRNGSVDSTDATAGPPSHLRPARQASVDGEPARPIGQGMRSSYNAPGSSNTASIFRRSSSVYIPNPSSSAPAPLAQPPSRLPVNLLSLAKRTAHLSDIPGYGWRLNLLEKFEEITGTFLTMQDAEAILSMGQSDVKKSNKRNADSRKSLIGMPVQSPSTIKKKNPINKKLLNESKGGFFGKVKRAFSVPHVEANQASSGHSQPQTKAIFGVPLSIVSEYGFVTSMIAGQRHDLPGVCFATVEEIYRRGQGMNVPGLMHLAGEASRVAKLVAIYDSPPDYGEHHDLSIESIHNVTSLLKKYLRDLPEPILDQRLWKLYLGACVDSSKSVKSRVACAQILLRLLPTPNFSLLVYLVAFLSQMPLFPENRLTLESVSTIFGPAAMSPRPSSASVSSKFPKMHITGPTDTYEAVGASAKKAQDGLLWLLQQWSYVADGLLEPDFDVDVDSVLERQPTSSNDGHVTGYDDLAHDAARTHDEDEDDEEQRRSPPGAGSHDSIRTLEILSAPRFDGPEAIANDHVEREDAEDDQEGLLIIAPQKADSAQSSPAMPHFDDYVPMTGLAASRSRSPERSRAHDVAHADEQAPPTPSKEMDETGVLSGEAHTSPDSARESDSTPGATASSRSSADSSLQSAYAPTPIIISKSAMQSPLLHQDTPDMSKELQADTEELGFERPTPEDENGPLNAPDSSVLEDVMEFDTSSIYSFPSPPVAAATAPQQSMSGALPISAFAPKPEDSPRPESVVLVRTSADQLKEAQALLESQRVEIQKLWKKLTDTELERNAERSHVVALKEQLRAQEERAAPVAAGPISQSSETHDESALKSLKAEHESAMASLREEHESALAAAQEKHEVAFSAMQTKFNAAQNEAQSARDQLRTVLEQRRKEAEEAHERTSSLESQLNAIRNLLGGRL